LPGISAPASERPSVCYLADAGSIHTQRWATHFAGLGHDVQVVSLRDHVIPGVRVHHVAPAAGLPKPLSYLLALPRILRSVRRIGADILHAQYITSYGVFGAIARHQPFVISAWGTDALITPRESRLARRMVRFALRRANLVTSMAHHMTPVLVDLGVPADRVLYLPFGVDTRLFCPARRSTDDVDIVSTRPFRPVYNVELLVRALPAVVCAHPQLRVVLVGDGELRPQLQSLADRLGVGANITWTGALPVTEIPRWLGRARVFVTTARSDGNNISLNEAMACGAFPIATDIPANREWLTDGHTGFLVPVEQPEVLANRIIAALASAGLRREAAGRNWQVVQDRADWHRNITRVEACYRRLMEERPR
jgi:glycosyltransferase involved in cell wall biosynthesis